MATNGDDLSDFLRREEEKFAEIGVSAPRTTPPSDRSSPEIAANEDEEPVIIGYTALESSEPAPAFSSQRRLSVEYIPPHTMDTDSFVTAAQEPEESLFSAEPECIQSWRREKEAMLEEKEAESGEEMRRWREAAQQELRDWYDHHNSQVETRKQDNRDAEQAFVDERDQVVPGTEWEKVANLCDFSAKGPGRNSKDVSRMRSIYLHLKENPPVKKPIVT